MRAPPRRCLRAAAAEGAALLGRHGGALGAGAERGKGDAPRTYGSTAGRDAEQGGSTGPDIAGGAPRRAPPLEPRGAVAASTPLLGDTDPESSDKTKPVQPRRRDRSAPPQQRSRRLPHVVHERHEGAYGDEDDEESGLELREVRMVGRRATASSPPPQPERRSLLRRAAGTAVRPLGFLWGSFQRGQ